MKISVTGARGTVGQHVVKAAVDAGHSVVQVNRTDTDPDGAPNSEFRTADTANDYDATVKLSKAVTPNNVQSAFNGFRACGELGIKKACYASSVNAIRLAYANQTLKFKYFPIDEDYPPNPTDAYALAKIEAETLQKQFLTGQTLPLNLNPKQ